MPNKFTISGIDDFRNLPSQIVAKAGPLTKAAAEAAKAEIIAAYPRGKGRSGRTHLQDGVILVPAKSFNEMVAAYYVISTAPHATPFEFGSKKHNQEPRPTFLPIVKKWRQSATNAVVDVVKAAGFTVTGDPE